MNAIKPTFVKDSDKIILTHEEKQTYRYRNPIESPFIPNYYLIPEFSRYVISRDGELRRHDTNRVINWQISKHSDNTVTGGYRVTSIYNDQGKRVGVSRHRLKMIVFSEYDFHPSCKWVNHKNGIPGDDELDNLEWASPSENIKHAYDNLLHPNKVRPITVLNWSTNEEVEFISIQAAADYLLIPMETIRSRLRRGNDKRYSDHWRFKYREDTWLQLKDRLSCLERGHEIVAIDQNGHVVIYLSSGEASRATGVHSKTIRRQAAKNTDKTIHGYCFKYLEKLHKGV